MYAGTAALPAGRRVLGAGSVLGVVREAVAVVVCDEALRDRVTGADPGLHQRVRAHLSAGTSGLLVVVPAASVRV